MQANMDDVKYISEISLTIRGSNRRTTMPKAIVDKIGLKHRDKIRWILSKDDRILFAKVREAWLWNYRY
jgi:bifunctional DNA-binding transcriptional regulator/antitoxin component of YhaV-PrlF toxin-antitoxin module